MTEIGVQALIGLLKNNKFIVELDVGFNFRTDEQKIIIKELLEHNVNYEANKLFEKISILDTATLYSTDIIEARQQILFKNKLAVELPELLLRLTDEQILEFNNTGENKDNLSSNKSQISVNNVDGAGNSINKTNNAKVVKKDLTFNKFQACLINMVDDKSFIENIFNEYANQTKLISDLIPTLCVYNKTSRKSFLEKVRELEKLNGWEIVNSEYTLETIDELDFTGVLDFYKSLNDFFVNKPLSVFIRFIELFQEVENMYISEEKINQIFTITEHHAKLFESIFSKTNWKINDSLDEKEDLSDEIHVDSFLDEKKVLSDEIHVDSLKELNIQAVEVIGQSNSDNKGEDYNDGLYDDYDLY